jgi:conflict system STAND superfamily ATPase
LIAPPAWVAQSNINDPAEQFDEIFTVCNDEAARVPLIENLLYATNIAEGRTVVALTMRADFYGQCVNYAGLRAAVSDHQSLIRSA